MIKKTIIAAALLATLTIGGYAQTESNDESLFNKGDMSVTLGVQTSYINSDVDSDFGLTVGIERGMTENLALGAAIAINDTDDSIIDEAIVEGKFALPLRLPVKPYVFGHIGYTWDNLDTWFAGLGFGAEWAFKSGFGVYGDLAYRQYDSGRVDADGYMFRAGIRLRL
jgi:hypothetical protein